MQRQDLVKKILYRSIHRGCKETDHLIGEFAKTNIDKFSDDELAIFKDFIVEDDLLIYDWILGKQEVKAVYDDLVAKIRVFHKIEV